jgi:hypothetical protein
VLGPRTLAPEAPQFRISDDLPQGYGTERLFLTARDPNCLYAAWDLTPAQRLWYIARSGTGHLVLRVRIGSDGGAALSEISVQADSKSWFITVPQPGTTYTAELGYFDNQGQWHCIATSAAARTPVAAPAALAPVEFATIPPEVNLNILAEKVREAGREHTAVVLEQMRSTPELVQTTRDTLPQTALVRTVQDHLPAGPTPSAFTESSPARSLEFRIPTAPGPEASRAGEPAAELPPEVPLVIHRALQDQVPLLEAVQQLRESGWPGLPQLSAATPSEWTADRARAMSEAVHQKVVRKTLSSAELVELIGRHLEQGISSAALGQPQEAAPERPTIEGVGVSSPGEQRLRLDQRSFWFNINAELVIYGATERDALVTVDGRPIRLRPDGTFSCRFMLPDGQYPLAIRAVSSDGAQGRGARLHFSRSTEHEGDVGAHPQDGNLKAPTAANFG